MRCRILIGMSFYISIGKKAATLRNYRQLCFALCVIFTIGLFGGKNVQALEPVNRICGDSRYSTAVAISQTGWVFSDTVILARGDNYADSLTGVPLAYSYNAPILLTTKDRLIQAARDELIRLKARHVIILGGYGAISESVESTLTNDLGLSTERIAGANRFDTAAQIAKALAKKNGPIDTAILAYGLDFPDALATAAYAAKAKYPILLVRTDSLTSATEAAINELGLRNFIAVGGSSVISDALVNKIGATRVAGPNRYATAVALANFFRPNSTRIFLSTGINFADAVTGGVLAAKADSSILLVQTDRIPQTVKEHIISNYTEITLLGGRAAVSDSNGIIDTPITKVNLNTEAATLEINSTLQLTAGVLPGYAANKTLHWSSSNTNVASVDASGLVTAKAPGTSTITATAAAGNQAATCLVTVQAIEYIENGIYNFKLKDGGKALNLYAESDADADRDGTNVTVWDPTGHTTQQFKVENIGGNKARIYAISSSNGTNRVLNVNRGSGSSVKVGQNIDLWQPNSNISQEWYITKTTDGYYKIELASLPGAVMGCAAPGSNGGNVLLQSFTGSGSQLWTAVKITAPQYEKAHFPMQYMNITQGVNGSYSHQGTNALDLAGKDTGRDYVFAPFTGVVKKIYTQSGNFVWLESVNKVIYADGTIDYMTIMIGHDNDVSDLYIGKVIPKGTIFYQEGTAGYATGNHVHLECGRGRYTGGGWYQNSAGQWMIYNSMLPYKALFIQDSTIIYSGYGYPWKK